MNVKREVVFAIVMDVKNNVQIAMAVTAVLVNLVTIGPVLVVNAGTEMNVLLTTAILVVLISAVKIRQEAIHVMMLATMSPMILVSIAYVLLHPATIVINITKTANIVVQTLLLRLGDVRATKQKNTNSGVLVVVMNVRHHSYSPPLPVSLPPHLPPLQTLPPLLPSLPPLSPPLPPFPSNPFG